MAPHHLPSSPFLSRRSTVAFVGSPRSVELVREAKVTNPRVGVEVGEGEGAGAGIGARLGFRLGSGLRLVPCSRVLTVLGADFVSPAYRSVRLAYRSSRRLVLGADFVSPAYRSRPAGGRTDAAGGAYALILIQCRRAPTAAQ